MVSYFISCWLVTDTLVFQLFKQIIQLLFRLKSQRMDWVLNRATVSESSLSIELSAGEVVRPAFDEQIKRSAGTLAFTLPSFQPLNQEGTFQMMPVCLSVFFGQTNPALCKPCYSVWWGNESPRGCIIPFPIFLPLLALFVCSVFVWLYNSTKPSFSVQ